MFKTSKFSKTTAIALATTMLVSSLGTAVTASAHDRHHPAQHGANHHNWNKHTHRQFHRTYGRGYHGVDNYQNELERQRQHAQRAHKQRKNKKRAKRAAIAAGIIGLAAGAIIASQASKNRRQQGYTSYSAPTPLPNYQNSRPQAQSLDNYSNNDGPNVVTFNDTASLEPWTPGWREWCSNRYRSFNASTGTYRGFDGLDHFCVPK